MGCRRGCVEQETDGSWVRDRQAGPEGDFDRAASRHPDHWSQFPDRAWSGRATARIKPESIPGDKFFLAAGGKPVGLCPERRRINAAGGRQRMKSGDKCGNNIGILRGSASGRGWKSPHASSAAVDSGAVPGNDSAAAEAAKAVAADAGADEDG